MKKSTYWSPCGDQITFLLIVAELLGAIRE